MEIPIEMKYRSNSLVRKQFACDRRKRALIMFEFAKANSQVAFT
jgi:hypothetical protein